MSHDKLNAEVFAVYPNKIRVSVDDLDSFKTIDQQIEDLKVGSYLEVSDDKNSKLIAIIESYSIEVDEKSDRKYVIDAIPLGTIVGDEFKRGGDALTIPNT